MDANAWKSVLGESAWNHIAATKGSALGAAYPEAIAAALTAACEVGFVPPTTQPEVSPTGTKVLFPTEDGLGVVPVLTAAGLLQHWRNHGHGFLILRTDQLMQAVAGPLFPWMQAIMNAYEEGCARAKVDPLPHDWRVFVGGKEETADVVALTNALFEESPTPDPSAIKRLHIAGPGAKAEL